MSGMIVARILRMLRTMKRIPKQAMVMAKQNTTVVQENKDLPKGIAVGHEHPLAAAVAAMLDILQTVKVMSIIVLPKRRVHTKENEEHTQSSEILIALPNAENSKKYTTYLGLINSGSSGSLLSSSLIENTNFNVEKQKKPTKWDTATGVLLTKGRATIEALSLPQFTRKRQVSSTFHLFEKRKDDQYDIILSRDFLQAIGLVIDYSASQFTWDNISVAMVPSGYWMKEKITSVAITWNKPIEEANNEMPLTEILPAEYKPVNIEDVVKQQTHLSVEEQEQLQIVLFEYQDLFKGQCRKYNGDPVSLELIPGSKPYYGKPFSIPKA